MTHTDELIQNNSTYIIGLTGGIGSGKSTVSKLLISKGYEVIDADQVAREVVEPGSFGLSKIVQHFTEDVINHDGTLNRKKLGEHVFNKPEELEILNQIIHPLVRNRISEKIKLARDEQILFIDIPLLFETDQSETYNETLLIFVDDKTAHKRIVDRDEISEELAYKKIAAQMSIENKRFLADYVIENNSTIENLHSALNAYLEKLNVRVRNWQKNNEH